MQQLQNDFRALPGGNEIDAVRPTFDRGIKQLLTDSHTFRCVMRRIALASGYPLDHRRRDARDSAINEFGISRIHQWRQTSEQRYSQMSRRAIHGLNPAGVKQHLRND
jgi:hypothetical protein